MYYVIKRQNNNSTQCFMGFKVPKFITSKNNENVIFEFELNGKTTRKWVKKEDVILLTEDKNFFLETMEKFNHVQTQQQTLVTQAQKNLEETLDTLTETVNTEIKEFEELRDSTDVPCVLKTL